LKEINWQDLKSFLTALAVGDFVSAAKIMDDNPLASELWHPSVDDDTQTFQFGDISLNTKDHPYLPTTLNNLVSEVQVHFNNTRSDSPATMARGNQNNWFGLHANSEHRYVRYAEDDRTGTQYFTGDPSDFERYEWLTETDDVLSREDLLKRKFEANLYTFFIKRFYKILATNTEFDLVRLVDRDANADAFHEALLLGKFNEQVDYYDMVTSVMDVQGMYELLRNTDSETCQLSWYSDWYNDWTEQYNDYAQNSWLDMKEHLTMCTNAVDKIMDNTKFGIETWQDMESAYKSFQIRIKFNLDGNWYQFISIHADNDMDVNVRTLAQVKYAKNIKQLVPKSYHDGVATKTLCPVCDGVVGRHNETLPFYDPRRMNRVLRTCFDCVNHLSVGYSLKLKAFFSTIQNGYAKASLSREKRIQLWESFTLQIQRNIKKNETLYDFFLGVEHQLYEVRFIPDIYFYDYSHELDWHLFLLEDDNYNIIKSSSANHGPTTTHEDAVQKSFFRERPAMPMGMELEIQYRDDDHHKHQHYIENLIIPLHRKFPYERPTLGQRQQLAIGSRDSSIGYTGVEFKFNIMSSPFVNDLPEEFWETLKTEWRGYHAKKCGIHISTSKSALNRPESFLMLTYHNNHVRKYHNLSEDLFTHNIMGDVFQRVDVPDYAEWHEVKWERDLDRADFITARDFRYASYLKSVTSNRQSVSRGNFINFANAENDRLEFRAFASATLKDRVLKNFEYIDAMYNYVRHLADGLSDDLSYLYDISRDDLDRLHTILDDELGFYFWLDKTGGFRHYKNLAAHLERHNIDKHMSNYVGDIPDALQDLFPVNS